MKRLKDQLSLAGELEEINVSDLRQAPGEVFFQIELGKTFVIKRHGKALAVLSKVPGVQLSITVSSKGEQNYDL